MTGDSTAKPIHIGLWGVNGHQIHRQLAQHPRLRLTALGAFDTESESALLREFPDVKVCCSFEEFLSVPGLEMVSLCSPFRSEQAGHAITALEAGIHVYAEKPCATTEADLDRIETAAARSTATFHEMAGTVCEQPYWAMRRIVLAGIVGEVVQVLAQKSYPYYAGRPLSERVDGGLVAQNGVHAMRFVEHITGMKAVSAQALRTRLGDAREGSDLRMACSIMGALPNGGIYSIIANYLNPKWFGSWGNEMARVFGTDGMVEAVDGGKRTRLVVGGEDRGSIDLSEPAPDWLELVLDHAN